MRREPLTAASEPPRYARPISGSTPASSSTRCSARWWRTTGRSPVTAGASSQPRARSAELCGPESRRENHNDNPSCGLWHPDWRAIAAAVTALVDTAMPVRDFLDGATDGADVERAGGPQRNAPDMNVLPLPRGHGCAHDVCRPENFRGFLRHPVANEKPETVHLRSCMGSPTGRLDH